MKFNQFPIYVATFLSGYSHALPIAKDLDLMHARFPPEPEHARFQQMADDISIGNGPIDYNDKIGVAAVPEDPVGRVTRRQSDLSDDSSIGTAKATETQVKKPASSDEIVDDSPIEESVEELPAIDKNESVTVEEEKPVAVAPKPVEQQRPAAPAPVTRPAKTVATTAPSSTISPAPTNAKQNTMLEDLIENALKSVQTNCPMLQMPLTEVLKGLATDFSGFIASCGTKTASSATPAPVKA